jgi:hypothetical protein
MTRFAAGMSTLVLLVCLGALLLAVSTMPSPRTAERTTQNVALVALVSAPENFDGASVNVAGFLIAEESESALYLSEDDAMARTDNKIGLILDNFARTDLEQADRLCVRVTGIFHRDAAGKSLGTITDMTRIVPAIRGPGGRLRYDEAPEILPRDAQ